MIQYAIYILAFLAGFAVKAADWLEDVKKDKSPVKYLMGIGYGLLIGYLISQASFSTIFLAALVAQVFAGKIDEMAHRLGFGVAIISTLVFGTPYIDIIPFGIFLLLAFLDEVDFVGPLKILSDNRLFLILGSIPFIFIGRWDYFAGIVLFDIGYLLFDKLSKRMPVVQAKS